MAVLRIACLGRSKATYLNSKLTTTCQKSCASPDSREPDGENVWEGIEELSETHEKIHPGHGTGNESIGLCCCATTDSTAALYLYLPACTRHESTQP